ncbi:NAD(P)-dependent dehydrogenase (short-subunit alcohol dehydrogenase family) [Novosphingobium capsulatum]|uniref:NAD(P)-dependent dehydrogenase (Short-subunit alcohol dehydrogenase family) n=1 Tax=Novosphingobium capsulatum TaxID=13688 RepID=A0ABU1MMN2_9SPHN|nr:oxidoreductase [Novosphingobium capsulatum]MDR6511605.1 NAD(P)-dependent dehydrogenase (short-subunit alcohol dehydrogenase family) [Novosphingobium capsulatum]
MTEFREHPPIPTRATGPRRIESEEISTLQEGFTAADVPDQAGKCFMVTGANTGIGFEVARLLAERRGRVLLACRDEAKATEAMRRIRRETPAADLAFIPLDLADLASARRAAERAGTEPRLDVLINNAGVQDPKRRRTAQGFEQTFGVNHLGCFALSALLLPKLMETPGSRIVVTSSGQHKGAKIEWEDLDARNSYKWLPRYAASKLANLLFVFELDRRLRAAGVPVEAVACHPGLVGTNLARSSWWGNIVMIMIGALFAKPAMGALGALHAATGRIRPGSYYGPSGFSGLRGPSGESTTSEDARNPQLARRLGDVSVKMTGIDPALSLTVS